MPVSSDHQCRLTESPHKVHKRVGTASRSHAVRSQETFQPCHVPALPGTALHRPDNSQSLTTTPTASSLRRRREAWESTVRVRIPFKRLSIPRQRGRPRPLGARQPGVPAWASLTTTTSRSGGRLRNAGSLFSEAERRTQNSRLVAPTIARNSRPLHGRGTPCSELGDHRSRCIAPSMWSCR